TPRYGDHQHFPATPEQIVRPPKESGRAEASAALLSAAAGAGPPEATRSETLQEKRERFDEEARYYYRRLTRVATLGLFALFTLCSLPLFVYAVLKLVRRRPVPDLSAEQKKELHRAGVWLTVLWPVAFVVPVLAGAMGVITCEVLDLDMMGYDTDEIIGFACGAAGALGMSLVLLWPVGRIRRVQASRRLPLLRKVVLLVPAAYLLLWAAFPALIFAQEKYILRDEWVVGVLALGAPILATAIAGVLSIAHHCATERVSLGRYVWYAVSRPFLVICAVFLLPGLLLPALGKARREASAASRIASLERNLMGEEVSERTVTAEPGEPGLKAPARVRRYFPETLLWRPQLITDDAGRAQLEVPLADSITTWRVAMGAVSKRGVLGSGQLPIRVFQDFFIDVDLPVALTRNDTVSVPVAVYNYLDRPQTVRLEVQPGDWFELLGGATQSIEIEPESVRSVYIRLKATRPGRHELQIKASGSDMADAVERHVIVDPHGKPVVQTINGRLEESRTYEVKIPAEAIDGASDLLVKIYPGAFSQVVEGLESIFRMPHGCFEQTSSVTYPNILALDYMRRTDQMTPELGMKALGYVNTGYQRLLSFEVSGGGFSLYGRSPAGLHLTALGLMQFSDMAEVRDVDGAVIERTRKWLYDQQRGDGSWRADGGGNTLTTTAYVAWALAASGEKGGDLDRALDYIVDHVDRQPSTYAIALCANALVAADHDKAAAVVDRLTKRTTTKGDFVHWDSKGAGVTHSYGRCFQVETTALAAQALLGTGRYVGTAHKALAWLMSQKDAAGTWHSTQATVQAMRALLAGADGGGRVEERTPVTITANSRLAKKLVITPETSEVHRLVSLRPFVRRGTNRVALEADIGGSLAYQIVATHYVPWPRGEQPETRKPITIDLEYPTTDVKTGEVLTAKVTLTYHRSGTAAMPIVELGVPPGFEVVTDALKAVRESGAIERYSVADRTVV
ncbi:MAG: alpha-2-macroglobulin family protein, partial [Planctomycetota bacterium]